jgi:hypothetical protein
MWFTRIYIHVILQLLSLELALQLCTTCSSFFTFLKTLKCEIHFKLSNADNLLSIYNSNQKPYSEGMGQNVLLYDLEHFYLKPDNNGCCGSTGRMACPIVGHRSFSFAIWVDRKRLLSRAWMPTGGPWKGLLLLFLLSVLNHPLCNPLDDPLLAWNFYMVPCLWFARSLYLLP